MNKDDKSFLDALWEAVGMDEEQKKAAENQSAPIIEEIIEEATPAQEPPAHPPETDAPTEEAGEKVPAIEETAEAPTVKEEALKEPIMEGPSKKEQRLAEKQAREAEKQAKAEEKAAKKQAKKAEKEIQKQEKAANKEKKAEALPQDEPAAAEPQAPSCEKELKEEPIKEAKKDIKFLVLYSVIFVIVISGLIGGSYLVSARIHKEMAQNNSTINTNESTLKNIQVQNQELKDKNAALEQENAQLGEQKSDAETLINEVGDMVEHDLYLSAAQNAFIQEDKKLATAIFRTIDRERLAEVNKTYYDTLKEKLGL